MPALSPSLFFLCCTISIAAATTQFDFSSLTLPTLNLFGDAHIRDGSVRLTRDLPVPSSGAGIALYSQPIRFLHPRTRAAASFSTFFSFTISNPNPSSTGAGLAFLITQDASASSSAGGLLGTPKGSTSYVAVEFDTLMDVEFGDVNGNHVGLDLGSVVSSRAADLDPVGVDLKSGDLVNAWIQFDSSTAVLSVYVSYSNVKPTEPVLSVPLELARHVDDFMFVGFSGSTQGSTETHSVEWWSFSSWLEPGSNPPSSPTATLVNPSANSVGSPEPSLAPLSSKVNNLKPKSSSCHNQLCKQGPGAVVGVVTASAFFLASFAAVLIWAHSKKLKNVNETESISSEIIKAPREFRYRELRSATKSFDPSRVIGHGAFGTVYRGTLPETGEAVAVKRCGHGSQGKTEFLSELSIIGTLRHRNLVRLLGWCHEKGEILLVYDLMPNGSLDKALFEPRSPLPWVHRRKILLGVASALSYLHQECETQVVHRDVKTSNIMLDEGYNARLGDFGLARLVEHDKSSDPTVAAGTMGYLAPEYLLTGRASDKTDVFSYGAVVLEVVSGRRPIEKEARFGSGRNLVEWVWGLYGEGRLLESADPQLNGEFDEEEMKKVLLVGLGCSHPDPSARPGMRTVVQMLEGEAEAPVVPLVKPSVSFTTSELLLNLQDSVSDGNGMIGMCSSSSSSEHGDRIV